ncbi:hypothetical protein TIFTF001_014367 [Ficus carica]|uniref:CRAL/TRIO N-terminal domain-containing protein n=1 Tax=Ficus carica TaxID=3494 RepID=A0AA88A3S8_FICCA|nr:hypothetical protein TIFTF001_014367 [Ficus carica]
MEIIKKETESKIEEVEKNQEQERTEKPEEEEKNGKISEMDEIEKSKVDSMRILIQKEDPSFKEVDDFTLRRFLRARNLDIEKASKMFLKYVRWRRSFLANGAISASEVPNEIAQNKFFMQGFDKKGRPIAVLLGARHKQAKLDEFKHIMGDGM